jgi:hypothetical protein
LRDWQLRGGDFIEKEDGSWTEAERCEFRPLLATPRRFDKLPTFRDFADN